MANSTKLLLASLGVSLSCLINAQTNAQTNEQANLAENAELLAIAQQEAERPVSFFDKLLLIDPDSADEYALLKQDVDRLTKALADAEKLYSQQVIAFRDQNKAQSNEYNLNESFQLFQQLKNQQHHKGVVEAGYTVKRANEKLYESLYTYELMKKKIEDKYDALSYVSNEEAKKKLLAGERFVLNKEQEGYVFELLVSYQQQPDVLAKLLFHPNVQKILPDYLKEQLIIFENSDMTLTQALSDQSVMAAVIDKIKVIDAVPQAIYEDLSARVYSQEVAPKVLDLGNPPLALSKHLDADTYSSLNLAQLYDMPIPSEEVVIFLDELKNQGTASE